MKILIASIILFSIKLFALEVPSLKTPVMDLANVLKDKSKIEEKILNLYNRGSGPQFAVLIIPSLEGESIESFSQKVFENWKLGDEKRDDGLLFILSINDRRSRIEVGRGLEGDITDVQSKRILRSLREDLSSQKYDQAVISGLDQLSSLTNAQNSIKKNLLNKKQDNDQGLFVLFTIIFGCVLFFIFLPKYVRKRDRDNYYPTNMNNSSEDDGFYKRSNNSRNSNSSSSSSDSSYSGGGGDSSGGGSSDSW